MFISIFDLFKIGIGPSSSHTVGPMVAAKRYLDELSNTRAISDINRIRAEVYGSLALTGIGHETDKAILLGLSGQVPCEVVPDEAVRIVAAIHRDKQISLLQRQQIPFDPDTELILHRREYLPHHPNGMRFSAWIDKEQCIHQTIYYSIGGGFVLDETEIVKSLPLATENQKVPYDFNSSRELLDKAREQNITIAELVMENELTVSNKAEILSGIDNLWATMEDCIERGCKQTGILPGRLKVLRRAPQLYKRLQARGNQSEGDPLAVMDWINLWAIAVNEENAAGGRVVTAPTNGAAGIIPAVIRYYMHYCAGATKEGLYSFFLTAAAVGALFKNNASISGAEVGCQGEVGVACSMAAAGLTSALCGSNEQIENAAEIGMEHNLGLTCDPIGGLVQIPCIERNAMGAIKAIDASRMAMLGDGSHKVSLDKVIATMRQTGEDMQTKYKETSQGGLAVNFTEC